MTNTIPRTMLSEDDFLMHMGFTDDMTEEEILEHAGVKGMKWGKRKASSEGSDSSGSGGSGGSGGGKSKTELRTLNKESRSKDKAAVKEFQKELTKVYDSSIDGARNRISSGENKAAYKDAKATYKADKMVIGKREAKKAFNEVKARVIEDAEVANLAKSGKETTQALVMGAVGLIVLTALTSSR